MRALGRAIRRLLLVIWLGTAAGWASAAGSLAEELRDLSTRQGFVVEGLDWIGNEAAATNNAAAPLPDRIRTLLQDYNYVLVQGGRSGVEKVRITSRKDDSGQPASAGKATVSTARLGVHHQVTADLVGPNGMAKSLTLIVDTGASTVVLPASLIPELGFRPEDLQDAVSQTASGRVASKIGMLRSVRVGAVAAGNVQVNFIPDARLQGAKLLGMSFLQRYRVTLDDTGNELILLEK